MLTSYGNPGSQKLEMLSSAFCSMCELLVIPRWRSHAGPRTQLYRFAALALESEILLPR